MPIEIKLSTSDEMNIKTTFAGTYMGFQKTILSFDSLNSEFSRDFHEINQTILLLLDNLMRQ